MSWRFCNSCGARRIVATTDLGYVCCTSCGRVVEEDIYKDEITFSKNAAGQSQMQGSFVRTVEAEHSASRERTLNSAYDFITHMIDNLGVGGGDQIAIPAVRFYEIAVEKNFVRGRIAEQVKAACLYIACRDFNKPFLLIEFSEFLRVNVYVLASLFIGLLMTGRKPSGLCGAALYISALSHGFKFSKTDVVRVVHICEATLTKRLIEFEGTQSGSLTIEEFNQKAEELENSVSENSIIKATMSKEGELLCEHKGSGNPHFAHGLCEACYNEFIRISGGLDGGSEPPAFQRAERERLAKACGDENDKNSLLDAEQVETSCNDSTIENVARVDAIGAGQRDTAIGATIEHEISDGPEGIAGKADDMGTEGNESDNFSDIDDAEATKSGETISFWARQTKFISFMAVEA
ncbi:hypothetical protein RND81_03G213700 [Saponaria officinalis]|uniref:Transcription factor TFIIB cyclin-like domain-containing protein n=1 Tax=Saponaria officinalis TaxID=3572 RepID=A0AAW1MC74_SAPOF